MTLEFNIDELAILKRKRIVFLIDDFFEFNINIYRGILDVCHQLAISTVVINGKEISDGESDKLGASKVFELAKSADIDGIIVGGGCLALQKTQKQYHDFIAQFAQRDIPVVNLGPPISDILNVYIEQRPGMEELIRHLIEVQGIKSFAYMRGFKNNVDSIEREAILRDVLEDYNLVLGDHNILQGNFNVIDAAKAIENMLLDRNHRLNVEVLVAANDLMAFGTIEALAKHGISVPKDIAVVGFDDRKESRLQVPALTTVRQPLFKQGQEGAMLLAKLFVGRNISENNISLSTEVMFRQSHCEKDNNTHDKVYGNNNLSLIEGDLQAKPDDLENNLLSIFLEKNSPKLTHIDTSQLQSLFNYFKVDSVDPDDSVDSINDTEADAFLTLWEEQIYANVTDNDSYLLYQAFLDFLDSYIVSRIKDMSKLVVFKDRLYRASEFLGRINRKFLTSRHIRTIEQAELDRHKDLRLTSATNLEELFDFVCDHLMGNERCFIMLSNGFFDDLPDESRHFRDSTIKTQSVLQGMPETLKPETLKPETLKPETLKNTNGHRLCFGYIKGERQDYRKNYSFDSNLLLPKELSHELEGDYFIKPLYVGEAYFGYVLIEIEDNESVFHETLAHSIAISVRNSFQLKKLHQNTLQLEYVNSHLEKVANYDALTGLANRSLFLQRLELACSISKSDEKVLALLFLDLDGFKHINDSLGHDAGDKLLMIVAKRLQKLIRSTDIVSRLGGDEFTILVSDISLPSFVKRLAEDIIKVLRQPFKIEGQNLQITTSVGIALLPENATRPEELLKCADLAMYKAKDNGKNQYQFYSPSLGVPSVSSVANRLAYEEEGFDTEFGKLSIED